MSPDLTACKRGHTTKHAPGFSVEQAPDGSFVLRTAAGFAHTIAPPPKPVDQRWPELPDLSEVQFTATEFLDVLHEIRDRHDIDAAEQRELQWEHDNYLFNILNPAS